MEIYNCKVLVGGSRNNEVRKANLPAAEIVMLRSIHGDDSVIEVAHVGSSDMPDGAVRELLILTYCPEDIKGLRLRDVFGPPGVPLPQEVEGVAKRSTKRAIKAETIRQFRDIREDEAPAPVAAFAD